MSFSIAVTVPFTTLPSKASFSPPRLLLRSSAKSSRVGNVVVAISSAVFRLFKSACREHATMASLQLRTWSNALPPRAHPEAASSHPFHGKKRVPVPVQPVHRTRSPKDGLPQVLN